MFLGEELGSDVAFKKVLALILRGNVSQGKALKLGFPETPRVDGEAGRTRSPDPRVSQVSPVLAWR